MTKRDSILYLEMVLCFVFFTICFFGGVKGDTQVTENEFTNQILKRINKYIPPPGMYNNTFDVSIHLGLLFIIDLAEDTGTLSTVCIPSGDWYDERLQWNIWDVNFWHLRMPEEKLWRPKISVFNRARMEEYGKKPYIISFSDGHSFYSPLAILHTVCLPNLRFFPFDQQTCEITFGSWEQEGDVLNMQNVFWANITDEAVYLANYTKNLRWKLVDTKTETRRLDYTFSNSYYPVVVFTLVIERQTPSLAVCILTPAVFSLFLSLLTFWIPPTSSARAAIGITAVAATMGVLTTLSHILPSTATSRPLLVDYAAVSLMVAILSVIHTLLALAIRNLSVTFPVILERFDELPGWLVRFLCFPTYTRSMKVEESFLVMEYTRDFEEIKEHDEISSRVTSTSEAPSSDESKMKWKMFSSVIDRLFFWFYVFLSVIFIIIVLTTE
ncbi:neuronal acetylcholine receptor subunit alpha-7-like [Limulus polyphemus]|uniref:Neuronal acetylcholine receptor subunit alpha-7-like n=1 Tax=Limulus polyphemus TaxID=6850 RepID=A0ABM1RWU4_LIMPO|nr:neuronal acetylcholine receptor subunit alpha-7-like [Limulus polyphemus]